MVDARGGMDIDVHDPNLLMRIPYGMDTTADSKEPWMAIHRQLLNRVYATRRFGPYDRWLRPVESHNGKEQVA